MDVKSLISSLQLFYLEYAVLTTAWSATRPVPVLEHDHVTLNCSEGTKWADQQIDWYYNSLTHIYRYETQERQIGYGKWATRARAEAPFQLTLHNISVSDDGFYSCDVGFPSNGVRTIRSAVNVAVPATGLQVLPANTTFMAGTVIDLSCVSLGGKPAPSLHWINETGTEILTEEQEQHEMQLQINISAEYNQKRLVCEAEQDHPLLRGHLIRQEITLDVLYRPHITCELKGGKNLTILCTVNANPPPSYIKLTKLTKGKTLYGEQNIIQYTKDNVLEYTKVNVDKSDEATYQVTAENSVHRSVIDIPLEYQCDSSGECGLARPEEVIPTIEPENGEGFKNLNMIVIIAVIIPVTIMFFTSCVVWRKCGRKQQGYRSHHDSEGTDLDATPEYKTLVDPDEEASAQPYSA
ncbi:cell adhesion molecule 1-like isoform X2 [Branchiostoma floridae x Branchiostoma japonicum]